jgi:Acetyltransferases
MMSRSFSETGLDRSLPHIGVIMEKYDTDIYPKYPLPDGFKFVPFRDGLQKQWAELQLSTDMADSLSEAEEMFTEDFLKGRARNWVHPDTVTDKITDIRQYPYYNEMCGRVVFVLDKNGVLAGTGALWFGDIFGTEHQRIHWVAVKPEYQALGISKAVITRLLDIYNELGYKGYIYLTSQTWSYKALNIYGKFGFKPYTGEKPEKWVSVNLTSGNYEPWDYKEKNNEAWEMINQKISRYNSEK